MLPMTTLIIVSGIAFLIGFLLDIFKGNKSADLQKNQNVKNEVANLNNQVNSNNSQLDAEASKRQAIEEDLKQKESLNATKNELIDFLNKQSDNK